MGPWFELVVPLLADHIREQIHNTRLSLLLVSVRRCSRVERLFAHFAARCAAEDPELARRLYALARRAHDARLELLDRLRSSN